MPLANYGLLTGPLTDHGPQNGGNPHYLLFLQAGGVEYRVAVNLESTLSSSGTAPELQYQVIRDLKTSGHEAARTLAGQIVNQNTFLLAAQNAALPRLDFVHGGVLDIKAFQTLPRGSTPDNNQFYQALVAAAEKAKGDSTAFVAVFGTGYAGHNTPRDRHLGNPRIASFGFNGVDNVHMNQGSFLRVGGQVNSHYAENGPNQDGAVLFFFPDGSVQGFFSKFQSQAAETDEHGNPLSVGISQLDAVAPEVRRRVAPPNPFAEMLRFRTEDAATPDPVGPAPDGGFVFAQPVPDTDPNLPFQTDDDSAVRNSPFVKNFALLGVPEPVPGPRAGQYPVLPLADVLGASAVAAIQAGGQIVFHAAGDTGAADESKLNGEDSVAALLVGDFAAADTAARPQFFFHLGDVVYFYGEQQYYYSQFYKPYKDYPAPIFAIPGNHDGITYNAQMTSLDAFIQAFCDTQPQHWPGAGGLSRTTMIQPGVFWTLDAPFVSVIGLYSNCSELYGYLDPQQKLFLFNELVRLKAKRESGEIAAVLLAVHHPPLSFSAKKPSSTQMRDAIDAACQEAGFWPDAVFSGHAHIYQRMTRTVTVAGKDRQIPYIISGSGGFAVSTSAELDKKDVALQDVSDPQFRLHRFLANYGYLRLTVRPAGGGASGTLRVEFVSPDINAGQAADACVLDLDQHQLL